MRLSQRKFIGIPVRTRSGHVLGKLADFVLESDTGRIEFLVVRTHKLIGGLMRDDLHVGWPQVLSLTDKEAIVVDAAVPAASRQMAVGFVPPPFPENASEP